MAVAMFATAGIATSAAAEPTGRPADVPAVKLTAAQRHTLQAQVTAHLKDYGGGKQISINQVAYDNGRMILTLPLPGEAKARAIDQPMTALGTADCAGRNACLWSDTNFNGTQIQREVCTTITLAAPFNSSTGSIHNNQTTGTQTVLMNGSRQILNGTLAPSRVHDTGVGSRSQARFWRVC
jgi:hypothetical protein